MKKYGDLEFCVKNPHFSYISGSRLYGMETLESDIDIRSWTIPPFEYLIGIKRFECQEMEGDNKVYSLKRFLELALKGDPQVSEGFFAPKDKIINISNIGESILDMKEHLISNAIFGRIMGYSTGEWRKAMGIKFVPEKWKKEKTEVINDIRNLWHPNKDTMDSIIKSLESLDKMKTVSSLAQLGAKRRADIEKYGFCRKSAAHAIRLVNQLTELMLTGNITFPRPDAKLLLDIRLGVFSKEELEEMHNAAVSEAESARKKSILPDRPNEKKVWEAYYNIVLSVVKD